jgi:hypothetical protein
MSGGLRKLLALGGFLGCVAAGVYAAKTLWPREMVPLLAFLLVLGLTSLYWGFMPRR